MVGRSTSRIDTSALKLQIERKLGHERMQKYFDLLSRYFSRKIIKSEFNKLCIGLIGRENLRLHNLLIQAIVKNASVGKTPPPKERKTEVKVPNGCQGKLQTICRDVFPQSPRKGRTQSTRARKFKDRPSPLGPNGKSHVVCEDSVSIPKVQEQQAATSLLSLGSKPPCEGNSVEDGEEVEQTSGSPDIYSRSLVKAPFGVSMKGKEPRKVFRIGSPFASPIGSCLNSGELPDTSSLKTRLEQKLEIEDLKISTDCVSLLNRSLDVYLKRLITPCLQLAGARTGDTNSKEVHKQVMFGLNGSRPVRHIHNPSKPVSVSLLDFRVAMELNPNRLGEDWPDQLEKVCLRVSDQEQQNTDFFAFC